MKLKDIKKILNCTVLVGDDVLEEEVDGVCAADLMSDVLAFGKPGSLLLTGLTNAQSIITAYVAEIKAVIYILGKKPDKEALKLAREKGIVVMASKIPMYEACGELYRQGLKAAETIIKE